VRGGADRDRTDDLKLAKLPLSQLSYGPELEWLACRAVARASERRLVGPERVERSTSRLSGVRSNHLSYEPDRCRSEGLYRPGRDDIRAAFHADSTEKEGKRRGRQVRLFV
jgi:hypothetical protein